MQRISTERLEFAYASAGIDEGIPLVLLHGFTGHRDDFAQVVPRLSQGRRVLAPDLRGHGESGRAAGPEDYTFSECMADLLAFLDALGIEQCDLLGHSMGGMVAVRFALEYPTRLRSLVLMSTSASGFAHETNESLRKSSVFVKEAGLAALQGAMEKVGRANPDPVIERWAERYWEHQRRRYAEMDPNAYVGFATAMIDQISVSSRLSEIRVSTSILIGSEDSDFLAAADELSDGIEQATRYDLQGAGHHPHEEEREQFYAAFTEHFQDVER